jgi:5-methyltetrahydrofolate--homocysteine methyltransferase
MVPVAREIGRMWHLGEIAIGEEHFTTANAQLLMGVIRQRLPMQPLNGRSVLIASVPGNKHELAGRIAGLLLESEGWRVIDLGTEMPAPDLVRAVDDFNADLVVLGVMLATQVEAARVTMHALGTDPRTASIPVIVGGHVFDDAPGLWKKMGAHAHARTIGHVVELADSVLKAESSNRPSKKKDSDG